MADKTVELLLEIGHKAIPLPKELPNGYTHKWSVWVRGVDNAKIEHCIDKVIFYLHESFPRPKRVFRDPPYQLDETGYAGFIIYIDICFKSKEQSRIKVEYDLYLKLGEIVQKVRREKLKLMNVNSDFEKRLLKAGAEVLEIKKEKRPPAAPEQSNDCTIAKIPKKSSVIPSKDMSAKPTKTIATAPSSSAASSSAAPCEKTNFIDVFGPLVCFKDKKKDKGKEKTKEKDKDREKEKDKIKIKKEKEEVPFPTPKQKEKVKKDKDKEKSKEKDKDKSKKKKDKDRSKKKKGKKEKEKDKIIIKQEPREKEREKELQREKEKELREKERELQREREREKELQREREIQREKELQREREIQREKELQRERELELIREKERELQREKELQKEREFQREIEKGLQRQKEKDLQREREREKEKEKEKYKQKERDKVKKHKTKHKDKSVNNESLHEKVIQKERITGPSENDKSSTDLTVKQTQQYTTNDLRKIKIKLSSVDGDCLQKIVDIVEESGEWFDITSESFDFDLRRLNVNTVVRIEQCLSSVT